MMKAVAYYRTRPSEPEASDLALSRQREAVKREVEEAASTLSRSSSSARARQEAKPAPPTLPPSTPHPLAAAAKNCSTQR